MVRNKCSATLQLSWTILLVCFVSTVLTTDNQKAKKGEDVTLMCNGKKPLNWLNPEGEIVGRQKGRVQQNVYGNLLFKPVRLSDSGLYTCSSVDGGVQKQIQLEISGPPTLVNITKVVDVLRNKEAVLNCMAEGHPDPVVTWFMYESGQTQKMVDGSTLSAKMKCEYCRVHFMCKAENKFGAVTENITVNVVGKPEVEILEDSVSGATGQNVSVQCSIKSNPRFMYMRWLKNGKLVQTTNRKKIAFKFLSEHETLVTLSIEKLKEKDFDEYECLAVNKYGNETQKIQITLKKSSKSSHRTTKKKPRVSPLSASTELVISSGDVQKQTTNSKNQDSRARNEEAATATQSSSETLSSNMGSALKNSWKQFSAMVLLPLFICPSLFLS